MFIKSAAVISKPQDHFIFKKTHQGTLVVPDEQINNVFLPDLKKVHELLQDRGFSLNAGMTVIKDFIGRQRIKTLITDIGDEEFRAASFEELTDLIKQHRAGSEPIEIPTQVPIRVPVAEPVTRVVEPKQESIKPSVRIPIKPTKPEVNQEALPGVEEDHLEAELKKLDLAAEQIERILEYKNKPYATDALTQKNLKILLDNVAKDYAKINDPEVSEKDFANLYTQIESGFEALDELSAASEAVEEDTDKEEAPEKTTKKKEQNKVRADKSERTIHHNNISKVKTELTPDEAIALLEFTADEFLSISNGELKINVANFEDAYKRVQYKILKWAHNVFEVNNAQHFQRPTAEKYKELNSIAFGIKSLDMKIRQTFLTFMNEVDAAIESNEDKTVAQNLIELKKSLNQQFRTNVLTNLMSYRLSQDSVFSDKIAEAILYIGSFEAFKNIKTLPIELETVTTGKHSVVLPSWIYNNTENKAGFIARLTDFSSKVAAAKFRSFWDIERESSEDTQRNIGEFLSKISAKVLLTDAIANSQGQYSGNKLKQIAYAPCPSCNRSIPVGTIGKAIEDVQGGFVYMLFVPITKYGDIITEDYMRYQGGKKEIYYNKPGKEYGSYLRGHRDRINETREFISKMKDKSYTWDEISALVNSSLYTEQIEGILRRSEAFRSVGAKPLAAKNISSIRVACPILTRTSKMDEEVFGTFNCGASFDEPTGPRPYNLQPKWNGSNSSYAAVETKLKRIYRNKKFEPTEWKDKNLETLAKAKVSGGYKYSKIIFGCPCHIPGGLIDNQTHNNHSDLAIPITRGSNYSPPTTPNGSFANIEPKTASYLICGANASLSSVDRNSNSDTYILKHISKLYKTSHPLLLSFMEFLIREGFDELELIQMLEDVDSSNIKHAEFNAKRNERLNKPDDIMIKEASNLSPTSPHYEAIKDLVLVCPFGHKFTIEQSLKFGASHTTIKIRSSTQFQNNLQLMTATGEENLQTFIDKYLVDISVFSSMRDFAYYDEWIKLPNNMRRINQYKKKLVEVGKIYLKININGVDYAFTDEQTPVKSDTIWDFENSRDINFQDSEIGAAFSERISFESTESQPGNKPGTEKGGTKQFSEEQRLTYSSDDEDYNRWEKMMSDVMDSNYMDSEYVYSSAIPGGVAVFDNTESLSRNMESLTRSVKAALTIINHWTNNVIEEKFGATMVRQTLQEDRVMTIAEKIFNKYLKESLETAYRDGGVEEDDLKDGKVEAAFRKLFVNLFLENAQFTTMIRKGKLSDKESAKKILTGAFMQYAQRSAYLRVVEELDYQGKTISFDFDESDIDSMADKILSDPEFEGTRTQMRKGTPLESQITIFDPSILEKKEHGIGKLSLIVYARFLAATLFKMQNLFFNKASPLYVGYNPMPRVFDSPDDILEVTLQDIQTLNRKTYTTEEIIEDETSIYNSEEDISELGSKYVLMINKAYQYLDMHTANARTMIITPTALDSAKKYVVNQLGQSFLAKYLKDNPRENMQNAEAWLSKMKDRISKQFVVVSSSYKNLTTADSIKDRRYSPNNILPALSGKKTKTKADFSHPFYDGMIVVTDPDTRRKAVINDDFNYNNSKVQVGSYTAPSLTVWPLPKYGYQASNRSTKSMGTKNHVGMPLPLYDTGGYSGNYSGLRDLPIINIDAVVEIPFQVEDESTIIKTNINFLLERGYSDEHYTMIHSLQKQLEDLKLMKAEEIKRLRSIVYGSPDVESHANKIEKLEDALDRYKVTLKRMPATSSNKALNERAIAQRRIEETERKLQILKDELENIESLHEKINQWYDSNVSKIQDEFNALPYSVSTAKSTYFMGEEHLGSLEEGKSIAEQQQILTEKSMFARPVEGCGLLHMGLADPVTAYKLIMTREIHGKKYVNMGDKVVPPEIMQEALINFIVGVYGLNEIAKLMKVRHAEHLKSIGINPETLNGRSLLELTVGTGEDSRGIANRGKLASIPTFKYDASEIMPGQYYNMSLEDSSISIQAYEDENKRIPTMKNIENYLAGRKELGITRPAQKEGVDIATVSTRAAHAMRRYIKSITQGEFLADEEKADDGVIKQSSLSQKILERGYTLRSIILRTAETMIDPDSLVQT